MASIPRGGVRSGASDAGSASTGLGSVGQPARGVASDARHSHVLRRVCELLGVGSDIEAHASRDYLTYQIGAFLEPGGPRRLLFYFQGRGRRGVRDAGNGAVA
jgi:hypothetical protein